MNSNPIEHASITVSSIHVQIDSEKEKGYNESIFSFKSGCNEFSLVHLQDGKLQNFIGNNYQDVRELAEKIAGSVKEPFEYVDRNGVKLLGQSDTTAMSEQKNYFDLMELLVPTVKTDYIEYNLPIDKLLILPYHSTSYLSLSALLDWKNARGFFSKAIISDDSKPKDELPAQTPPIVAVEDLKIDAPIVEVEDPMSEEEVTGECTPVEENYFTVRNPLLDVGLSLDELIARIPTSQGKAE